MKSFQEYLTENLGNLQSLPSAVVKRLANWNMIGQNSTVIDFTSKATADNLNREVNALRKEESSEDYFNVYIIFNTFGSRYDYDKREDVQVPITVVLKKDTSRASTYDYNAYHTSTGEPWYQSYSRGFRDKNSSRKLTDFNFSEITKHSKVWVVFNDNNRVKLRGERGHAQVRNDPLSRSATYGGKESGTVNAEYAKILFNQKVDEAAEHLKQVATNLQFVEENKGDKKVSVAALKGLVARVEAINGSYGTTFPYPRDGRVSVDEFKKAIDVLNKLKAMR